MSTKNIGQVSGVHIGSTPPVNIIMIWYDNTPSQMVHKVYDVNLSQWVVLDKNTISTITYSELVNLATSVGLSVGAWFKISDRSNVLALAVTTTKVQYSDSLGNVLIDDLGANIQYHVTSSNLSIDDVVGVFDNVNKKLVFQFNEQVPDYTADDFILGKVKRNNVWSLAKYKLSSFLSKVTGNSISWNGGFFFNFNNAVSNILDKTGGVVSKDTYDEGMENVSTAINNVGQENQTIIQNANQAITNATLPTAIYEKALPSDLEVGGAATNISKGDTLYTLISKIQRWINQFKLATGIKVSSNFIPYSTPSPINNNDTVDSAFRKVQKYMNDIGNGSIPEIKKSVIYDYIVDSDDKLKDLVRNADATTVLIKKGTWTFDFGENTNNVLVLHENTTLIHCENEAYIKFVGNNVNRDNNTSRALITRENVSGIPSREYCDIRVITDITQKPSAINLFDYIFSGIDNLHRCVYHSAVKTILTYAFHSCQNLYQCTTKVLASEGFEYCDNLYGCYITKTIGAPYYWAAFRYCNHLQNCYCNGSMSDGKQNFVACKRLSNCWVNITTSSAVIMEGFSNCEYMTNCYSKITPVDPNTNQGQNFSVCSFMNNCEAEGNVTNLNIYAFWHCYGVSHCRAINFNTGKAFEESYSQSGNTGLLPEYLCDNTANGGFNLM